MCAAGENFDSFLGKRVESNGVNGTVCYVGEVVSKSGVWLGVDWDDPNRGRHNGSYEGVKYFEASQPTSGSFVTPAKVNIGISCTEAITSRYGAVEQNGDFVDKNLISELQKTINAPTVEMVGFGKVSQKQSRFETLKVVCLTGIPVKDAGEENQLSMLCPLVEELSLERTLIADWDSLASITRQLTRLRSLNVSWNRISLPNKDHAKRLTDAFINILFLQMNSMRYSWENILHCAVMFPNVQSLMVMNNGIAILGPPQPYIFTNLKELYLSSNALEDWEHVNTLGNITSLQILNLSHNHLTSIFFPGKPKTDLFASLQELILSENRIDDWESINELHKLSSLRNLAVSANPLLDRPEEKDGRAFQMILGKIGSLKILNGSIISSGWRKGAEYDYMKRYGPSWLAAEKNPALLNEFNRQHPRYAELVKKYGAFEADELQTKPKSTMVTVTLFSPNHPDRPSFSKRLPQNMSVQKLSGLAQKLMNTGGQMPTLSVISARVVDAETVLDKDLQELSYYSVEDGDSIGVRW